MDHSNSDLEELHVAVIVAGHTGDERFVRSLLDHPEGRIRSSVLAALQRMGRLDTALLTRYTADVDSNVRRRVAELAAHHPNFDMYPLLHDDEPLVVEMAAWSCGEQGSTAVTTTDDVSERSHTRVVPDRIMVRLVELVGTHDDPLVRESAVAALGALEDERGLPAILAACSDKPAIRRRAVLALAPFAGDDVDAALKLALSDRDWQVRQAAEDILGPSARETVDDQDDPEDDEEN